VTTSGTAARIVSVSCSDRAACSVVFILWFRFRHDRRLRFVVGESPDRGRRSREGRKPLVVRVRLCASLASLPRARGAAPSSFNFSWNAALTQNHQTSYRTPKFLRGCPGGLPATTTSVTLTLTVTSEKLAHFGAALAVTATEVHVLERDLVRCMLVTRPTARNRA
jgi:hypothetical protein